MPVYNSITSWINAQQPGQTAAELLTLYAANSIVEADDTRKGWKGVGLTNPTLSGLITRNIRTAVTAIRATTTEQREAAIATAAQLGVTITLDNIDTLPENLENALADYQSGEGLNFADPVLRGMIAILPLFGWSQDFTAQVLALGEKRYSQASVTGNLTESTMGEWMALAEQEAAQQARDALKTTLRLEYLRLVTLIDAGTANDIAGLQAAFFDQQ